MPAAHHLPNPFGPNSAGGTIATELAAYASRHSSPGVGGGLVQAGTQQSAHTLFGWPAACGDMGASDGGSREVGRKSRRGASESRSPEVSMHSCSGADLAGLDSPRSLRHGGSSTDSLTAPYCQVCCDESVRLASMHVYRLVTCIGNMVGPFVTHPMGSGSSIRVFAHLNPVQAHSPATAHSCCPVRMQVAGPDIAAQLIHDDDAQQLGCAVEALVAEEQAAERGGEFRPARRQRTGEAGGAARSVLPSADEDLIDYITTGARSCTSVRCTVDKPATSTLESRSGILSSVSVGRSCICDCIACV